MRARVSFPQNAIEKSTQNLPVLALLLLKICQIW